MDRQLWTGALTFRCPEDPNSHFGIVAAQCAPSASGSVTVILNKSMISIEEIEGGVRLSLPESWAVELAKNVELTAMRLSHLRSLNRLGLLNDSAFVNEASKI